MSAAASGAQSESTENRADTLVVLDFETTGLSPRQGDRVIEIGAVLLVRGRVEDRFQALMNPGFPVSRFIEDYTGITNDMLGNAPPCADVMRSFAGFLGGHDIVAHNAQFDRRFLDAEFARIGRPQSGGFACSMLVARRLYPHAPNHKLGTLVRHRGIAHDGVFHRALADAEMTARLWLAMLDDIRSDYAFDAPSFALMQQLAKAPRHRCDALLARGAAEARTLPA